MLRITAAIIALMAARLGDDGLINDERE